MRVLRRCAVKILAVDDSRDGCNLMAMCLRKKGHDAKAAFSGRSSIQEALTFLPDMILLDIGLPDLNGWDAAREMRQHETLANTKIYALTGYGETADIEKSLEAGMNYHFVKPLDMTDLWKVARMQGLDPGEGNGQS